MRETLWIVSVLFLLTTIGAPNAHADSITDGTINFTVSSGSPAPTGSFSFDNTTNAFTSVDVEWDGGGFLFSPLFGNGVSQSSPRGEFGVPPAQPSPLTKMDPRFSRLQLALRPTSPLMPKSHLQTLQTHTPAPAVPSRSPRSPLPSRVQSLLCCLGSGWRL